MPPKFSLVAACFLTPIAARAAEFSRSDSLPYLPPSPPISVREEAQITPFSPRLARPTLTLQNGVLPAIPGTFGQRPSEIYPYLTALAEALPDRVKMTLYGESSSGASLVALEISPSQSAINERRLAVVCRQHGNEPEATASGIRLMHQFLRPQTALQKRIAARTRLLIVPIANPDGAQIYERRTAQNIDMNRDWLARRSPEVRALVPLISRFKPHLVVDNHQWLPADRQPVPMAETGGGSWAALRAAKLMSSRSGARGLGLKAKNSRRGAAETLAHRFWGKRAKIPAILLETRHNPGKVGAREKAIVQATTALWGAAESLGK